MKVVINSCFGGFGLSKEALLRLHEIGCEHTKAETPLEYYGEEKGYKTIEDIPEKENYWLDTFNRPIVDGKIISQDHRHGEYNDEDEWKIRACPVLVQVVEELGSKANGTHARLTIVEIPDDVKWFIDEYDGIETIHEEHQNWS